MLNKRGLTLVELIAVVIILGILMAIGIPQYRRAMERARGAEAYSVLDNIHAAEKIYQTEFETYVAAFSLLGVSVVDTSGTTPTPEKRTTRYWNYVITVQGASPTFTGFTATATRRQGPCAAKDLVVSHTDVAPVPPATGTTGTTITRAWEDCVQSMF